MLATEADGLRALDTGTYTLGRLYALCQDRTAVSRNGGEDPVPGHPGDLRWKRRVRGGRAGRLVRPPRLPARRSAPHDPPRALSGARRRAGLPGPRAAPRC